VSYVEPVHPVRGDALTPLERQLWRFRTAANEAQVMLRGFHQTGDVAKALNDDLLFSLTNHALIIVCKFLEVWDDFGRIAGTDLRVRDTRRAVQPYIDRIRVWKGLEQFRNGTLAHAYLTKEGGQLIGPWDLLAAHKAPSYHAECLLLLQCAKWAALAVLCSFAAEYVPLRPILRSAAPAPSRGPGIANGKEIDVETRRLAIEVDERLSRIGIMVGGTVAQEFVEAEGI
jgi:hypothetical protein